MLHRNMISLQSPLDRDPGRLKSIESLRGSRRQARISPYQETGPGAVADTQRDHGLTKGRLAREGPLLAKHLDPPSLTTTRAIVSQRRSLLSSHRVIVSLQHVEQQAEERMFVAVDCWPVPPGKEEQFRRAWRRGTERIRVRYGSVGSGLHCDADGRFVGYAEWPDEVTWRAAFDKKMVYDDPETRAAFVDAVAEVPADADPIFTMTVTDDLLMWAQVSDAECPAYG